MGWRATIGATALTATLVAATPARALEVTWVRGEGAEACADADALRARIASQRGETSLPDGEPRVVATVVRHGDAFVATMTAFAGGRVVGERAFESGACDSVVEAVALAVSLLDEEAAASPAPDPPRAAPTTPSPTEERVPSIEGDQTAASEPRPLDRARLGLHGTVSYGLVPGVALGTALIGAVRVLPPVELVIGAEYATTVEGGPVGHALTRGLLGVRVALVEGTVDVGVSGALSVGALSSRVEGLEARDVADRLFGGADAALDAGVQLGPVRLTALVGLVVPFVTRTFVVEGRAALTGETSPVSFRTTIGVEVQVP